MISLEKMKVWMNFHYLRMDLLSCQSQKYPIQVLRHLLSDGIQKGIKHKCEALHVLIIVGKKEKKNIEFILKLSVGWRSGGEGANLLICFQCFSGLITIQMKPL